ncbi:HDIG domain-containing metalloprotein [Methanococcus sp. CF]
MIPDNNKALYLLNCYVKEQPNLDHNLIVGYGMLGIAKYLKKDENEQNYWFVTGVLHDIDIEEYENCIEKHCIIGEEILRKEGISENLIDDIKSHNDVLKIERNSEIRHALWAVDALSGIIRAYVLMRPDRDIKQAELKSIKKKLKDKSFAQNVSREQVKSCEENLNMPLDDFINSVLNEIKENISFK